VVKRSVHTGLLCFVFVGFAYVCGVTVQCSSGVYGRSSELDHAQWGEGGTVHGSASGDKGDEQLTADDVDGRIVAARFYAARDQMGWDFASSWFDAHETLSLAGRSLDSGYLVWESDENCRIVIGTPCSEPWRAFRLIERKGEWGAPLELELQGPAGVPVAADSVLIDVNGIPYGPVGASGFRLPKGWQGYVVARGFALTPLLKLPRGRTAVRLCPSSTVILRLTGPGLQGLAGRRSVGLVTVKGVGPGNYPPLIIPVSGPGVVRLPHMPKGRQLTVSLLSPLCLFAQATAVLKLDEPVHEVHLVAYRYASVSLMPSGGTGAGQPLFVAPYFQSDPKNKALDLTYPSRRLEWAGDRWRLGHLRSGTLAFWCWNESGQFGSCGPTQLEGGTTPRALDVDMKKSAALLVLTDAHELLVGRRLELIVCDAAYRGDAVAILRSRKGRPELRVRSASLECGQALRVSGLWARPCRLSLRDADSGTVWEGSCDLTTFAGAQEKLVVSFRVGQLQVRPETMQHHKGLVVRSLATGERIPVRSGPTGRVLVLREGSYEALDPIQNRVIERIRIEAGQCAEL
jgi:hypothetical protein